MTLIDRLSKLDGARYVMDVAIALETDFWPKDRIKSVVYNDNGDPTVWFTDGADMPLPPAYTASVDAAIALAGRLFPGTEYEFTNLYNIVRVSIEMNGKFGGFHGEHVNSLPIAICIAILRAKEASHGE